MMPATRLLWGIVALAAILWVPLRDAAGQLYWTDKSSNRIQQTDTTGGCSVDMISGLGWDTRDVAIWSSDGVNIFASGRSAIQRWNGSLWQDIVLAAGDEYFERIAIDSVGLKMYWTDFGEGKLLRADFDGLNKETIVSDLQSFVNDVAVDGPRGKVYWSVGDTLRRANVNGTQVETIVIDDGKFIRAITIDSNSAHVYWTNSDNIKMSDLDGSNIELLVSGLHDVGGIDVDLIQGRIVWSDNTTNKVQYSNLDGSQVTDLVVQGFIGGRMGLAVDSSLPLVYWVGLPVGTGQVIYSVDYDGCYFEDVISTGLGDPEYLAIDVSASEMYWTDSQLRQVFKSNIDGSGITAIVAGVDARGIAVDPKVNKIYWADPVSGKIQRSNLDGTYVEGIVSDLTSPTALTLDLNEGSIFWTDLCSVGCIMRSDLNGNSISEVYSMGGDAPTGIALDVQDQVVYWLSNNSGRVAYDGSGADDGLFGGSDIGDLVLSAESRRLFWTNGVTIHSVKTDGTDATAHLGGYNFRPVGLSLATQLIIPRIRYVTSTGSDPGNDCSVKLTPCATVANAVARADDGDIIDIGPGIYMEPGLLITKNLLIRTDGPSVVIQ